jgi:uncharacterized protein (TIGR04255 family)
MEPLYQTHKKMTSPGSLDSQSIPQQRLQVPKSARRVYAKNFTSSVVCELRIPTLMDVDREELKVVAKALRKRFPINQSVTEMQIGPGLAGAPEVNQHFKTRDGATSFLIRPATLILETKRYESFPKFRADVELVASATRTLIDADFFTRVGIRYINAIPVASTPLEGWINPILTKALEASVFGQVRQHLGEVRGFTKVERGEFTFKYGWSPQKSQPYKFLLDFDFFMSSIDSAELLPLLDSFHDEVHDLFEWSIGEKSREAMGPATVQEAG